MNLEEAELLVSTLQENNANDETVEIMFEEIHRSKYLKRKDEVGAGMLDSIETC